jgi:hypothetical protein
MRRSAFLLFVSLFVAQPAWSQAEEAQPDEGLPQLAVLPLRVEGMDLDAVERLDGLIRERAGAARGMGLQAAAITRELVAGARSLGLSCELVTAECAAEFGALVTVDVVLLATAAGYGDGLGLDLQLIEVSTTSVRARTAVLLPASADVQAVVARRLVDATLAAPGDPARLELARIDAADVGPPGARLVVDGADRGTAPFDAALTGLLPGLHVVELSLEGHTAERRELQLAAGEVHALSLQLQAPTVPDRSAFERALPWMVSGTSALVALAGTTALVVGALPWVQADAAREQLLVLDTTAPGGDVEAAELYQTTALHDADWRGWGQATVVGGGVLAGVGVMIAFGALGWGLLGE